MLINWNSFPFNFSFAISQIIHAVSWALNSINSWVQLWIAMNLRCWRNSLITVLKRCWLAWTKVTYPCSYTSKCIFLKLFFFGGGWGLGWGMRGGSGQYCSLLHFSEETVKITFGQCRGKGLYSTVLKTWIQGYTGSVVPYTVVSVEPLHIPFLGL